MLLYWPRKKWNAPQNRASWTFSNQNKFLCIKRTWHAFLNVCCWLQPSDPLFARLYACVQIFMYVFVCPFSTLLIDLLGWSPFHFPRYCLKYETLPVWNKVNDFELHRLILIQSEFICLCIAIRFHLLAFNQISSACASVHACAHAQKVAFGEGGVVSACLGLQRPRSKYDQEARVDADIGIFSSRSWLLGVQSYTNNS